ncbi:IS256 family transposase [Patescibacteria group bacterium]|nr:MAG: IS256 family transposase [Patescibacteria group bacterium]
MSQPLREKLQQELEKLKAGDGDTDWLKGLVHWLLQELLELEFSQFLGAERYERSEQRQGYRNGHRQRQLHTRVGTLTLQIPRDREGCFCPALFSHYQRSEQALVLALQEMYLQGVSTRKVAAITEELCGTEFSKDQVSQLACELDEDLEQWRSRPLRKRYPYLVCDARYEHVREDGRVVSEGVLLVKGIDEQGYREILSVMVAPAEEEASWGEIFADLLDRGLNPQAVSYVVSDDHRGLRAALARYLPGALWQWCQTHYQRNAGAKVLQRTRKEVHARLRDLFDAPDAGAAKERARRLVAEWQGRFPELATWLEETIEQALTVFALPQEHRKRLRTTNGLERFEQELKRRSRVVRIFPNRASCLRLMSALALEQSEEWLTGHRYLQMTVLEEEVLAGAHLEGAEFTHQT